MVVLVVVMVRPAYNRNIPDENPAHLEPAMTVILAVVPLDGCIDEECGHLPCPLRVVFPGENRDRVFDR
jgi:hypothetical protein